MKQNRIETTRSILTLIRELLLIGALLLLLIAPSAFKSILQKGGIKSIGGLEFRNDLEETREATRNASLDVLTLQDSLSQLNNRIDSLIARAQDENTREDLRSLQSTVTSTKESADQLDTKLKSSLQQQEQIYKQVSQQPLEDRGWIFLGKINEAQTQWLEAKTIEPVELPIEQHTQLTLLMSTYLRADTEGNKSDAKILNVLEEGKRVRVLTVDLSHAKAGGWFVWAKVEG